MCLRERPRWLGSSPMGLQTLVAITTRPREAKSFSARPRTASRALKFGVSHRLRRARAPTRRSLATRSALAGTTRTPLLQLTERPATSPEEFSSAMAVLLSLDVLHADGRGQEESGLASPGCPGVGTSHYREPI